MSKLMLADMGLNIAAGLGSYFVAKEQSKIQEILQKYQNTMADLSAGMAMNNLAKNRAQVRDNNVFADLSIQSAAMQEQAAYQVEAAAAGVVGNSVAVGMRQREADAARAQSSRERQYSAEMMQLEDQKKNVQMSSIYNRDVSPIQKPSLGASLLGIGANLVQTWDAHNPVDRRVSTRLAGE